ncbi:MAG: TIGR03545 family protein [Bdellovibrionales bacterium]|nr:TIGR03545 family protein [Bdellovibrionales bacterium]
MSSPKTPEKEKEKVKKVKGPLRLEAVVPVTIICVCAGLYFSFLFDSHLRFLIEFTGTHIHGAEVNVGRVKTSFLGGSFRLSELQVTDKEDPSRNLFSIGEIRFGFLWDALLRAKFVVEEASIVDIQAFSPRLKPGKILPVEVSVNDGKSPALAKLESGILDQTKKEFEGNLLSDLANIIEGADPTAQIKNLESDLKSNLKIKELETNLKEKQALWDARIKALPRSDELKDFETRVKAIKVDTKDPITFAASIGEIQSLVKEADQKIKSVKEASDGVNNDLKTIDTAFKDLDQVIKQDIQDLEKHFKIPQIDVGDFSKKLFGKMFAAKLVTIQKYITLAREYLPPQKTEEQRKASADEQIVLAPEAMAKLPFSRHSRLPSFWLKKASISSEPSPSSEYSGRVKGELLDLTSNPAQIGKPTVINFEGDFPKQMLMGLVTKITLDHTTDNPKETMQASIASFPVQPQNFQTARKLSSY